MEKKDIEFEHQYFDSVNDKILKSIESQEIAVKNLLMQVNDLQNYYVDSRHEIDDAEVANIETELNTIRSSIKHSRARQKQLETIKKNPYFGRIDFTPISKHDINSIYIGIHDFESDRIHLIYDWRAPISSMFYDFKLGNAQYFSPSGIKYGVLSLKRQFKISSGKIHYMFDTSMNINDEVLQQELGSTSSNRMRNIINTIQSEQNKVIRNEDDDIIIIQGHAGSGKTSIALHRIAYLLYRQRSKLKSEDILIISPNKIFSDYISNVLPELGEEKLAQISIEDVVKLYIDPNLRFDSSKSEVISEPLKNSYFSSLDIINDLDKYAMHLKANQFIPHDIKCKGITLTASEISKYSRRTGGKSISDRKNRLCDYIIGEFEFRTNLRVTKSEKIQIKELVSNMYSVFNGVTDFVKFFDFIKHPEFAPNNLKNIPFIYVFPYIYLKLRLNILELNHNFHHIVIDEMQDYTPIQYKVLHDFFNSQMTILGDVCQSINDYISTSVNDIAKTLPNSEVFYLNKSYRSTYEIMTLALHVLPSDNIEIIERHASKPKIFNYNDSKKMYENISKSINDLIKNGIKTIGIIVRSEDAAYNIYKNLSSSLSDIHLLTHSSTSFENGVSITSTSLAKGVEFDHVIIPDVNYSNYNTELDRHHLYVGITRAKHSLDLYFHDQITPFLLDAPAIYSVI